MKKALVFAGGGSKGAYQIGAWKALEELGERYQIATGTSIGSINAAFYVQHDFAAAEEMWSSLKADDIMTHGINMDKSLERMFSQRDQLLPFIKTYMTSKGADVTPFHNALQKYFNAEKFFSSDVDFALITVKFPSFAPVEKHKSDFTDRENAWQWLAASGACFPVFPVMRIDGEDYVDGGYYDNIPVAPAFKLGADEVTVIDLKPEKNHQGYFHHPRVRYIKPSRDLGTFMNFDRKALDFSMQLGYLDVMKAYEAFLGQRFAFSLPPEEHGLLREYAAVFVSILTLAEARFDFSKSVKMQRVNSLPGCTTILSEILEEDSPTETQFFLAGVEQLMEVLAYDPLKVYPLKEILYELKIQVDGMYPMLEYDTGTAFSYVKKFITSHAPAKSPALKDLSDERMLLLYTSVIRALQHLTLS